MLRKIALMIVVAFSMMESPGSTQELEPNSKTHIWSKIAYPPVASEWGIDQKLHPTVHAKGSGTGWEFELLIKGPKDNSDIVFDIPISVECKTLLHTADGRIRSPHNDLLVVKNWDQEAGEWNAKATSSFPWTRNDFDEAWIEFRTPNQVYYFELPYGFTRDPRSEICLPSPRGNPELVESIQPIERGSQVVWWHHVEYNFGEVEPGWQLLLWVSNPFDMHCSVFIRPLTDAEELPEHLTKIKCKLHQPERRDNVARQLLGTIYPDTADLSDYSFESNFNRNPKSDRRWGQIQLSFRDQRITTVVPSSLFHYVHGVSDYFREAEKFRTNYGPQSIDPRFPFYRWGDKGIEATIRIGGSRALPAFLLSDFGDIHPGMKIETEFNRNANAIDALVKGDADLVVSLRQLTKEEQDQFKQKFGQEPILIPIAIERVGVFVHAVNPISERGLTLAEADAIFSTTRNREHETDINLWGDLGLKGQWLDEPIQRYSGWGSGPFNESTLFKRRAIVNGEFKEFRRPEQSGAPRSWRADYNFGVGDKYGISFGIVRNELDSFKAVPLGQPPVFPTAGNCYRGDYPLTENLSIIVSPNQLDEDNQIKRPAIRELLKFVLSRQRQMELSRDYLPLSYDLAKASADKVGINLHVRKSYLDVPPAIAGLLSQTNSPEDFESLMLELSQPVSADHNSSKEATRLIRQWHRSKNFAPLIETVTFFDDSRSAISAALALVSLGRDEYWANLRTYSRHDNKRMRSWLIHELSVGHHSEAIEIFISLLDDDSLVLVGPRTTIADKALEALCSQTNQHFGKDKSKWREWWDMIGKSDFKPRR